MGEKKHDSALTHLVVGGLAGLFSDAIVHPIDTIRVRLMTKTDTPYRNATHAFFNILKHEGVFHGLYKGFSAVMLGTIPGHALYFFGYERSKSLLNSAFHVKQDDNILVHLASGFVADVFGSLAWTPMDVIKQRLQVIQQHVHLSQEKQQMQNFKLPSKDNYKGIATAVRTILRDDGPRGLFRGMGSGLLTYGPYVSLYFALYEQLKLHCVRNHWVLSMTNAKYNQVDSLPFYMFLLNAALASSVSSAATTPLDVVKTRIQVQQRECKGGELKYRNSFHAFRTIMKEEGVGALFHGVKPRCLWISSGTALTMLAYEEIKKFLRNET